MKRHSYIAAWSCFVLVLVFYVITSCRTVPPYRDSGELITSACTLSIAHSPGYPTYMVFGKFFITLGGLAGINPAWSMNLFSGIAGAMAIFFVVLLVFELTKNIWASIFSGLLAGFSYMNWYLSVVSEMYSLNLMFVVMLLYLLQIRKYILFSFIAGLMLGNHLTSLFAIAPMGIYILFVSPPLMGRGRGGCNIIWKKILMYFFIGVSVYFYLPIRSCAQPFINWGAPSGFLEFWQVVSRTAYGHTLDLISREVTIKQVFFPHLWLFIKALARDLSIPGLIFALAGIFAGIKKDIRRTLMLLAIFIMTGPFFLYMARMPVNPHAVSIVEVSYMVPEMILALFAGFGILKIINSLKLFKYVIPMLAVVLLFFNAYYAYSKVDKSKNYVAEDYALNILNTVGKNAAVIMRRDHTMFSLWYKKDIDKVREDVKVISKGLLSAGWYRDKLRMDYPEIKWKEKFISDENYIRWFYEKYSKKFPVYLTPSAVAELSKDFFQKYNFQPFGLVLKIVEKDTEFNPDEVVSLIHKKYRFTGAYQISGYYDFFTKDFVSLYAQIYDRLGMEYFKIKKVIDAKKMYRKAVRIDPLLYKAYSNLAYSFYFEGNIDEAEKFYINAMELLEKKIKQYTRKQFFKKDLAEIYNNLGAIYEKKLRNTKKTEYFQASLTSYNKAIGLVPAYSEAYYNRGVLFWGRDWKRVTEDFETALKHDPSNVQIKKYLIRARKELH